MEDIFAHTTTTEKVTSFSWKIDNFLEAFVLQDFYSLEGPVVNMPTQPNTKWSTSTRKDSGIYFYAEAMDYTYSEEKECQIKLKLSFQDTKGNCLDSFQTDANLSKTRCYISYCFSSFDQNIPHRSPLCKLLSDDGCLILRGYFIVIERSTSCSVMPDLSSENDLSSLSDSLKALYSSKTFSDFSIVVRDKIIPVHKCILSSRSPVFAAMLKSETLETQNNKLVIEDFDFKTMETFISYVYTGQLCELSAEEYLQLYFASDKYGLESLNKMCLRKLINSISVDNVCDMYTVGHYHNDTVLKNAAKAYLSKNVVSIMISESWKKMTSQNSQIAAEMLKEAGMS